MAIKRIIKFIPAAGSNRFIDFNEWINQLPTIEKDNAVKIDNVKRALAIAKTETGDIHKNDFETHSEYYYSSSLVPEEITDSAWYNLYERFLKETGQALEIIDEEI